jgi:hypothetical protein
MLIFELYKFIERTIQPVESIEPWRSMGCLGDPTVFRDCMGDSGALSLVIRKFGDCIGDSSATL